ncbi:DinB family protein [Nocardioides sp. SYSU D00038]|uniref:DinB family protein n=1 Tax=Nocardioides sp. SYSU D00038 TaxID=2812554 RepID=UPI0019676F68|nr:DinB family protein [Nocardioides sp. SYSU D00038]
MFETQRRPVPRRAADEIENALMFIGFQREAVLIKCEDLDEEQLRRVLVPSGTNLLGLVQHMTTGEEWWFQHHVAGELRDREFDFGMDVPEDVRPEQVLDGYRAACARADAIVRAVGDPDALTTLPVEDQRLPLRWVLGHVLAETARHAGHADILRELLDGTTGR